MAFKLDEIRHGGNPIYLDVIPRLNKFYLFDSIQYAQEALSFRKSEIESGKCEYLETAYPEMNDTVAYILANDY